MELIDVVSDMGKSYAKESTGVVATPAAQTKLLIGLREMTEAHFVSLFSCNLFTAKGRSSFVEHWNRLDFTENFEWAERNEQECGELNQFQCFLRFKKALDSVNTVMVSAIEGNNRMMSFLFTAAERKVHPNSTIDENEPNEKERLTEEYLKSSPSSISNSVLKKEGSTSISEGVQKMMTNTDELMINLNATFPTMENDEYYPVTQMLTDCRESSLQYCKAKTGSNRGSDFDPVTKIVNQCIARTPDGEALYWGDDVQKYGDKLKLRSKKNKDVKGFLSMTTATPKSRREFAETFFNVTSDCGLADTKLLVKAGNETLKFPFPAESLKQLNAGKKHKKDLVEMNLNIMVRPLLEYCSTICGETSADEVDERVRTIVENEQTNLSESKKFTKFKDIGKDYQRGTCAFVMIQAFYTAGGIYGKLDKILRLFDTLGKDQLSQKQHWNGLSKYNFVIIFLAV